MLFPENGDCLAVSTFVCCPACCEWPLFETKTAAFASVLLACEEGFVRLGLFRKLLEPRSVQPESPISTTLPQPELNCTSGPWRRPSCGNFSLAKDSPRSCHVQLWWNSFSHGMHSRPAIIQTSRFCTVQFESRGRHSKYSTGLTAYFSFSYRDGAQMSSGPKRAHFQECYSSLSNSSWPENDRVWSKR